MKYYLLRKKDLSLNCSSTYEKGRFIFCVILFLVLCSLVVSCLSSDHQKDPTVTRNSLDKNCNKRLITMRNGELWLLSGNMTLWSFVEFISNYTNLPLIVSDRTISLETENITINQDVKVSRKGQLLTIISKHGFLIDCVSLTSGRQILHLSKIQAETTRPPGPLIIKPSLLLLGKPLIYLGKGRLPVLDLIQVFANLEQQNVLCVGLFRERASSFEIVNAVDIKDADAELIRVILEAHGLQIRHVISDSDLSQWYVSLPAYNSEPIEFRN